MRLKNLTLAQRWLVHLMATCQHGRIENLLISAGQPLVTRDVRIVRIAKLGGDSNRILTPSATDDFELKRALTDLFDELGRLQDGVVQRLDFRHGLPSLVETLAMGALETKTK